MHSVWNTISGYTYFYISKNNTSYALLFVFKIFVQAFSVSLKYKFVREMDRKINIKNVKAEEYHLVI